MTDALKDVAWVKTINGNFTVQNALAQSSQISGLDLGVSALEISATFRILHQVMAVALRFRAHGGPISGMTSIDSAAVDTAIELLGSAADLEDPVQPFLQRPALPPKNAKDTSRFIGPGDQPVKKLYPYMPPLQAESFWSLSSETPDALNLEDATRALAVFHSFSLAGNNVYDGNKCGMGAPGIRFLGKDNTSTEVLILGDNLFQTLLLNIPYTWVEGTGLPAWADRKAEVSFDPTTNELHPLWCASWSSNAPVCLWENDHLIGVRVGGIPESWFHPLQGKTKEQRKLWWDLRNTADPLYLYRPDQKGELKAQRLDIERDIIDLAVEWNAESKSSLMTLRHAVRDKGESDRILFLRHQIGGTASSPSIRASEVLLGDPDTWAPNDSVAAEVREYSLLMSRLHQAVIGPFRRARASDKAGKTAPTVLDTLEVRRKDSSAYFWRAVSRVFQDTLHNIEANSGITDEELTALEGASLRAFDDAMAPHQAQLGAQAEYVRGSVQGRVRYWINKFKEGSIDDKS